jgi:hypothetical protein
MSEPHRKRIVTDWGPMRTTPGKCPYGRVYRFDGMLTTAPLVEFCGLPPGHDGEHEAEKKEVRA